MFFLVSIRMYKFLVLFLFFGEFFINSAPIEENVKENEDDKTSRDDNEQPRAGITDILKPLSGGDIKPSDKNKDNDSGPLGTVQNFFTNGPHTNLFNGTNPFQQLISPGNNNFLDDIKVFLVTTQGMMFPASAVLGGFQSLMQNLGNFGNLMQGAQNMLPPLPGSQ